LARAMDRSSITKPGFVKGKIAYLAPELTYEADPSAQTDLFSVGVVLWEVLAGEKLFKGKDPLKVVGTIRGMEVPNLAEMRRDVPTRLREIIERALQRDANDRYPTAHAMGRDLAALLRATQKPTDSDVIAKSIQWAQRQPDEDDQTEPPTKPYAAGRAVSLAGAADETIPDTSIPLVRRRR
ncbi:MAG: protein kinase, partial [Myxococcales bacterium]|nr:protein kinase [Myxococcales bacterium]